MPTRLDFTRTKMPYTRDRRRTRRVSAAVLTIMASMAAVCLWVEQLWRLRHLQLQGSADDADPMLRTSPPNRSESGEDDFAHEKSRNTERGKCVRNKMPFHRKSFTTTDSRRATAPTGTFTATSGVPRIGNLYFDHGAVLFIGCSMDRRKQVFR